MLYVTRNTEILRLLLQREELKELIKEANEKEQQNETGSFMYVED